MQIKKGLKQQGYAKNVIKWYRKAREWVVFVAECFKTFKGKLFLLTNLFINEVGVLVYITRGILIFCA